MARANGERGRVLAARLAIMCKLYCRDPVRYRSLQSEITHAARRVVYHMRQASLLGALIARLEGKSGSRPRHPGGARDRKST